MKRALWIRVVVYSLLSLLGLAILSGVYLWYSMQNTMDAMYEPLPSVKWVEPVFESEKPLRTIATPERIPVIPVEVKPEAEAANRESEQASSEKLDKETAEKLRHPNLGNEDPFGMLLLGVDERAGDRGRSDTMILLAIQPKKGSAIAISIPRDTRALMPDSGKYDKINHSYAYGGTSLAVEAVERLFGVPIAYYMKTNMEGLVNIVDTLGGVEVDNQIAFDYGGYNFPQGAQHLDGEEALAYSRMRKQDPQGDFGRTQRQRQVLSDAVDRVVSVNSITKLPRVLSHLSEYIRTNLTSQNMIDLALKYRPSITNVETISVQGRGTTISGIYYYEVTPEERRKIQATMLNLLSGT